jgi:uncharacterized protein YjbI with pentapeptide repeats
MSADAEEPESEAGEAKPPKMKAEDNPWYLLATLYGVPGKKDYELKYRNRVVWNRYFARMLDRETHARFEKQHTEEELTPFSLKELRHVAEVFAQRRGAATAIELPRNNLPINFSNVEFYGHVAFEHHIFILATFENSTFPFGASFTNAIFRFGASFNNATFVGPSEFADATFNEEATFSSAAFDGEVRFSGAIFSGLVSFGSATFTEWVAFNRATFRRSAIFGQLIEVERPLFGAVCNRASFFGRGASFEGATFAGKVTFRNAVFSGQRSLDGAVFDQATFSDLAIFGGTTFDCRATFRGALLIYMAGFKGAIFVEEADFTKATLSRTTFERTIFSGQVEFNNTVFADHAIFLGVNFEGPSSFVNAEMNGETSFEDAVFKTDPPRFFGAKLHQGTVWRGIKWPTPKGAKKAGTFIEAYACLKLEMDRLKKHEDELDLFALEMQSRRALLGPWRGLPIAIYGALSDFGRSYLRPLVALFYLALIGTLAFLPSESLSPGQSLGLSFANSLNVFGFRRDFFEPAVIARLPTWLEAFSALQTILGAILLFLVGLGIRNKFRMK